MNLQTITTSTLDNGLTVYLVHDPLSALISAKTYVRAGSLYEDPLLGSGLSHYLEHLVAGGTTIQRNELEYKALIAQLGGSFNAYTTLDHTCYYLNTLPDYTDDAIQILCEWMFHNSFSEKEFLRERDVIIKEIEKNNASISRGFFQFSQNQFYQFHPAKYPVIGFLDNFKAVTMEQLKHYYHSRYVPSNMALIVGGNLTDPATIMETIHNTFGKLPYKAPPPCSKWEEPPSFSQRWNEKEAETQVTYMSIRFPGCDIFSPDLYPLDLLDFILGNGENSVLYKELVEDKQLAYNIQTASYTPAFGGGYFEIMLELDYDKKGEAFKAVLEQLSLIKSGAFSEKQISQAKKQKLAEHILSITTLEEKVEQIGHGFITARSPHYFDEYTQQFREITGAQVATAAKHYLNPDKAVISVFKPKKAEKTAAISKQHLSPAPILPTKTTLKNGVRILSFPTQSHPQKVVIKAFMLGGIRAETPLNNGIGSLFAELWGKASQQFSKDYILDEIEGNGAELDGNMGNNTFSLNFECLTEDLDNLLPIFIDSLIHPIFTKNELNLAKRDQLKRIRQRQDDWHTASSLMFRKKFFGNHPYGFSHNGEIPSVEAVTVKDIEAFFASLLNPQQLVISVIGDFDENAIIHTLTAQLDSIPTPSPSFSAFNTLERALHKKPATHHLPILQDVAALYVGFDGLSFAKKDLQPQLELLHTVMCGIQYPTGRLHNHLRDRGLVYMVHGSYNIGFEPHSITLCALTSSDKIEEVKSIVFEQIADLQHSLVGHEEFNQALAQLRFFYRDRVSSLDSLAVIIATDELYGFGFDLFIKRENLLQGLSPQDIRHVATDFLQNPQVCFFEKKKDTP
jgi:zinc protease